MIEIDGSLGEGGGQILRSSLSLSAITKKPFKIINIRRHRKKPGLRPQHLCAVRAAASVTQADVKGDKIGSLAIVFEPGATYPGEYQFDVGTAGSTSLIFQTICIPLALSDNISRVMIIGGTHVKWSPCFQYLDWHWRVLLKHIGFDFNIFLELAGYFPKGGGKIHSKIKPVIEILPIVLLKRGQLKKIKAISATSNLPKHIGERQHQQIVARLEGKFPLEIKTISLPSVHKGTVTLLLAEFESQQNNPPNAQARGCFFSLGELGKPAEKVADEAVESLLNFLATEATVDRFLADQLLLPLSLANGASEFITEKVTPHLQTNATVIERFLSVKITIMGEVNSPGNVKIEPQ